MGIRRIGLSLSFCIKEILSGKVWEGSVDKIVSGTSCRSDDDWEELIQRYREVYWRKDPNEGEAILRRLLEAGKIEQPRLNDRYRNPDKSEGYPWISIPASNN
tara:strand:- start:212 stop:520 length:309 start_codon:yes stop_codon:yes gene_type:complete